MAGAAFDYVVIGKGLIGSAAARHLSAGSDSVALVGPDEPADRATHAGPFGSYYDAGRITRVLDPDATWALLAKRSIERYRELEEQTGIRFYHEVGYLAVGPQVGTDHVSQLEMAGPKAGMDYVSQLETVGRGLEVAFERLSSDDLETAFPYLSFDSESVAFFQATQGGHVNPRSMLRAQTVAAERRGTTVLREIVHSLRIIEGGVELTTESGGVIRGRKALVTAGAFTNVYDLLPGRLNAVVEGRTNVFAEVSRDTLGYFEGMPSVSYVSAGNGVSVYVVPPIEYPDRRFYVKIGSDLYGSPFQTLSEMRDWFRSPGSAQDGVGLTKALRSMIPFLERAVTHTDSCAVTITATGLPYIDLLSDGVLGFAVGGNGKAAKSSDEIGRLAAEMLSHGAWRDDLPAERFQEALS